MPDDQEVPRLTSTSGWRLEWRAGVPCFLSPDGRRYAEAGSREVANLIREFPGQGLAPVRLRDADQCYRIHAAEVAVRRAARRHEARRRARRAHA